MSKTATNILGTAVEESVHSHDLIDGSAENPSPVNCDQRTEPSASSSKPTMERTNGDSPLAPAGDDAPEADNTPSRKLFRRVSWQRAIVFGLLPIVAFALALGVGYLKWQQASARVAPAAAAESVQAASDGSVALLSYRADTVEKDLDAARGLLTGDFQNEYTKLINDVVIPGAQAKKISSGAEVVGAASLSATADRAVVLVFINQTTTVGADPATNTASTVRVTLEKEHGKWLISQFEPV